MTKIIDIPILAKAKEYRESLRKTFIFGNEPIEVGPDLDSLSDKDLVQWYKHLHHIDTKKH